MNIKKKLVLLVLINTVFLNTGGCAIGSEPMITDVATGHSHCAAVTDKGELYIWGSNGGGYFRENVKNDLVPKKVLKADIVSVEIGYGFGGALSSDGTLYMWGNNSSGQLGRDQTGGTDDAYDKGIDSLTPIKVMSNVISFTCSDSLCMAITENGDLYRWGNGNPLPEKILSDVEYITSVVDMGGHGHSRYAAITEGGSLYSWGYNGGCMLGTGSDVYETTSIPEKIMSNVASVSLGNEHSAAITEDGSLYMWGNNRYGQLGNGEYGTISKFPVKIMDNIVSVSLGDFHSAAITEDGSLYMWGENGDGQLGNDDAKNDSSIPIKIMENVASVCIANDSSAAITNDGTLYMWGDNYYGQLGNGSYRGSQFSYDENIDSAIPVEIMSGIARVSQGNNYTAAITEDGTLYTWGGNDYGQVGNKTTNDVKEPFKVKF